MSFMTLSTKIFISSNKITSEYNPPTKADITILYCFAGMCKKLCVDFNKK